MDLGDQVCRAVVLFESDQGGLIALGLQRQVGGMDSGVGSKGDRGRKVVQLSAIEQAQRLSRNQVRQPRHILWVDSVRTSKRNAVYSARWAVDGIIIVRGVVCSCHHWRVMNASIQGLLLLLLLLIPFSFAAGFVVVVRGGEGVTLEYCVWVFWWRVLRSKRE